MTTAPALLLSRLTAAAVLALLVGGCGLARQVPIEQGNPLPDDKVSQLQEGMTREQVRFLLGPPIVPNTFGQKRWSYVYYELTDDGTELRRLIVHFRDDEVSRIEQPS